MHRVALAIVWAIALLAASIGNLGSARPVQAAPGTTLVNTFPGGSMVVEEPLYSRDLSLSTSYRVFLPPGYADASQRYPVLYMLHGVAGDSSEWQSIGLLDTADRMIRAGQIEPMLIVLPNGGANYWVNHADGARWGDFMLDDVVPSVDGNYRSIADRSARAIGGLSMGGEGALRLAMMNPDTFGVAAAHSPSLRTAYDQLAPELQDLYGTPEMWRATSPLWLTVDSDAAYRLTIALDVGEDDPWRPNVEMLHNWMTGRGIAHRFDVLPGGHEAEYWIEYVNRYLTFYSGALASQPVAKAPTDATP
jgi:enterochelin esterase-like enzyme